MDEMVRGDESIKFQGMYRHNQIQKCFPNQSKTINSHKSNVCKLVRLPISGGIEEISLLSKWTQEV
jgi:hypothetical protein